MNASISALLVQILVAAALTSLVSTSAFPQEAETVKVRYDRHNPPPDEVFLPKFIEHITGAALSLPDREQQIGFIGTNLNLDNPVSRQAAAYLDLFVQIRDYNRSAKTAFVRDNLCPLDSTRPGGDEFLARLDDADEHADILGLESLSQIRDALDEGAYGAFETWMNRTKLSTTITRYDHQALHSNTDLSILAQDYCARFDRHVSN